MDRRLSTFRAVVVSGARQVGKTTLLRSHPSLDDASFVSFDRPELVERATESPVDFLEPIPRPIVIDEYQRAGGDLILAVKYLIDQDDSRGQFVLAGSTNFLTNRRLSEVLAGRVGLVDLRPLSIGEQVGVRETFIDAVFDHGAEGLAAGRCEPLDRARLAELVATGGYPEAIRLDSRDRQDFFDAYAATIVGRESLEDVGAAQTRTDLRTLLRMLAALTANEYHPTTVGRDIQMSRQATANYVELIDTLGLVDLIPAWSTNLVSRLKKSPKLFMNDTGLASALTGFTPESLARPDLTGIGSLVETLVVNEVTKAASWSSIRPALSHFQDQRDHEVDLILEAPDGRIVAIETKATSNVRSKAFGHLAHLRQHLGDRMVAGIVLHGGTETWRYKDNLWATPISNLWAER